MKRRISTERRIATMSRDQLLLLVRDPLAPAKAAMLAYNRLEGFEA